MSIKPVLIGLLSIISSLLLAGVEPQQALPITSHVSGKVKMVLIHPTEEIVYDFLREDTFRGVTDITDLVKELQNNYDLVYVSISDIGYGQKLSIYNMKKSARLSAGNGSVECADFYDVEISSTGHAYFSSYSYDYVSSHSAKVSGFFLFPKVINIDSTQRVSIECEIDKTRYRYEVNFERLRNLINVLSDN
jgi:hypothetical protein